MSSISNPPDNHLQRTPGQRIVPAACVNCHDRKVRCDAHKRGFPCSNCISFKRANCRKHEKKKRHTGRPSTQYITIKQKLPTEDAVTSPDKTLSSVESSTQVPTNNTISPGNQSDNGSNLHLVEFVDRQELSHRSILRGVRISYVGKDVSNMNFLVRQRDLAENEAEYHFATNDIDGQYTTHEPDLVPREAFILPERELGDQLVEAYFTHVNPGCPLVDEDIFMGHYRKNPADTPSMLVLQAILLVGAHVSRDRPDRDILKATFFRRAKILFDARLEKNRDFIVQAALLLTWHSDGPDDTEANAWFWVGIAARTAMGLGLHRDRSASKLFHIDSRTWERLWWLLVQFDVLVSLFYGRPQAINLDECDVPPLKSSDFEGCGPNVQIDYIIKRTELCVLISRVIRERFGLRTSPEQRTAALGQADESLANWSLNLPNSLQLHSSNTNMWTASLHLTYNNFLIILHRPHPKASPRGNDHGANDSDICSSAANAIASIFENLRAQNQIRYLWVSDINALFTTLVQLSVELRFSNPILAINALRRFDSTLLSLRNLVEYWTNAAWILRVFEESSHVQHGIRMGKGASVEGQAESSVTSDDIVRAKEPGGDLQDSASYNGPNTEHVASGPSVSTNQTLRAEPNRWEETAPQPDSISEDIFMSHEDVTNIISLDNEWREIYWEEPGIFESFGDGLWG